MIDSVLARKIETTGTSTVFFGSVCVGLAGLQAIVPPILDRLAASVPAQDDPTRPMREAWSSGAGEGALVNLAFGVALMAIGVGVARRARWAHPALTIACWASVAVLVVLAKPSAAPFVAMAGGSAGARAAIIVLAAGLIAAQVAAVVWFLRFWSRPDVREAFRRADRERVS